MSDPSVMPKVVYSYPGEGTTGPYPELFRFDCQFEFCSYYSQFQVRFNKYMDLTSVRRAVRLSGPDGNIRADTNFILSMGGDVFVLSPVDSNGYRYNFRFVVGGTYSMGIDSTARDINGNALVPPFTATFVPEPSFRVMSVSPADGAIDVPTYFSIYLFFNSKVSGAILPHLSIDPLPAGSWSLAYDSTYAAFNLNRNLTAATTFTLNVDGSAEDIQGNRISAPYVSRFTTVPFRMSSTYPSNGAGGVWPSTVIQFAFSIPLDTGTVRSSFHISPATAGTLNGIYYGSSNLTFAPEGGFAGSTSYTITFDSTLHDIAGDPLTGGYTLSFTTAPFSIFSTTPSNGETGVSRFNMININTNAPLNLSSEPGSLQITPAVSLAFTGCDGCSSFYFYAPAGLAPNTAYTVTIGTGLLTKRGEALPAPYTFSFTTGP
jgi:hypothetical protein